jgi:hypothetical protein
MYPETLSPTVDTATIPPVNQDVRFHRSLSWGAIFAGTVTAIGIHLLMLALGVGMGLAAFTPLTDQNPAESFTVGTGIAWSLCALVALFVGGWIAGCFSAGPKSGCLHGVVVWSVTMAVTFLLASTGGGLALGGVVKALGSGLGMMGQGAAAGASDLAKAGAKQATDQVSSFIDEAAKSSPTNAAPNTIVRGKREIGFAVTKLFAPSNDVNSTENQAAVSKALTEYAGMNEADAKRTVADWVTSYHNLKAELDQAKAMADQKAREAAEKAAARLSCAATISFFVLLIGLIVTVCGGIYGAKKTCHHTTLGFVS